MVRDTTNIIHGALRSSPNNEPERSWDRVKNLITYNSDELKLSVAGGAATHRLIEVFKQARVEQHDLVGLIQHGVECSRELGTYLDISILREDGVLSLGSLNKLLSKKSGDTERDNFINACNVLLSSPETSCLGALILSATMYPLYEHETQHQDLRAVVCLLNKLLEPEALLSWSGLASQSLFWSYNNVIADAPPSAYIVAAQLGRGCLGLLTSSAARERALEIVRLFIPKATDNDGVRSSSQAIPSPVWNAFSRADQVRILSKIDTEHELMPWVHSVLDGIRTQGEEIKNLCDKFLEDRVGHSSESSGLLDSNRDLISYRFGKALSCLRDLCGFLVDSFEGGSLGRKLKTKLEQEIVPDIAQSLEALLSCMHTSDPILSCDRDFADALNQLMIETLRIPLDIQREQDDDCPSFFSRVLLPTFRHALVNGDLGSALSLRMLFPQQVLDSSRRDIVDEFVSTNQSEIRQGILAASRRMIKEELSPDRQCEIESFRSALIYLVDPNFHGAGKGEIPRAIALLVRELLKRDELASPYGFWGCQQVGEILLPIKKIPSLIPRIGQAIFGPKEEKLVDVVARFISWCNESSEPELNSSAPATLALYQMCKSISDKVPAPVTRYVQRDKLMAHYLANAKKRWCVEDLSREATSAIVAENIRISITHIEAGDDSGAAHGQMQISRMARVVTNDRQRIDKTNCHSVVIEAERVAKEMLSNIDSRLFEVGVFQATFAEMLAALFWGNRFGITEKKLFEVASLLAEMVESSRGHLICDHEYLRGRLSLKLGGSHIPGTLTSLLKDQALRDLVQSWN